MFQVTYPQWDTDLFIYLNSKNHPWLDPVMVVLSTYTAWIVVCALILVVMVYKDRIKGKIAGIFLVGGIITNLVLNIIIKSLFMRPRPGSAENLKELIHQLEQLDGSYSFFSGHSSSSICLAVFTILYFRHKIYGFLLLLWALAVAYSRIYVGKHYPLDVMVGIIFGLFTGYMAYWCYKTYINRHPVPPASAEPAEEDSGSLPPLE